METLQIWLCTDCLMVSANGTDGWGLDETGAELGAVHLERMVRFSGPFAEMVPSGCPEGETCDFHAEDGSGCRFDLEFSSLQCDGCGTFLAGARHAAVQFLRSPAPELEDCSHGVISASCTACRNS